MARQTLPPPRQPAKLFVERCAQLLRRGVRHLPMRALESLQAAPPSWPLADVVLADDFPAQSDPRETYWPCEIRSEGGSLRARPLAWKSSGDLCGLAGVKALLQLLPASGPLSHGALAKCLLLDLM